MKGLFYDKKIFTVLFCIVSFSLALTISSCGDGSDKNNDSTRKDPLCLTNSTLFCIEQPKFTMDDLIKEDCKVGLSLQSSVTVFGKTWMLVNFSKAFNQCFTDLSNFTNVANTNSTSVLINFVGVDLSKITSKDKFLNTAFFSPSDLQVRPHTNLQELFKSTCISTMTLGDNINVEDKLWYNLSLTQPLRHCYNALPTEDLPHELDHYGSHIGIRVDNNDPSVDNVQDF